MWLFHMELWFHESYGFILFIFFSTMSLLLVAWIAKGLKDRTAGAN